MQVRVAKHERRALEADRARSLHDDGLSLNEIAEKWVMQRLVNSVSLGREYSSKQK
jgi:hypothetical protein